MLRYITVENGIISAYLPLVIGNIRKYSINEYWNKGNLSSIWSTKIVQYLASKIKCIDDMELITNSIAEINTDDCIYLDAIEDDLNDLDLIKDIVMEYKPPKVGQMNGEKKESTMLFGKLNL